MDGLDTRQVSALEQCLEALDTGATVEECLAQHAGEADALRPLLDLRAGLLAQEPPPPPAHAYQAGRQALVEALHAREAPAPGPASSLPRPLTFLASVRWHSLRAAQAPLARVAAVVVAVALVGVGTLGASAAGGFEPARDVLSALRIVGNPPDGTPADQDGLDGEDEGGSVPPADPDLSPEQDGTEDLPGGAPCETPDFLERLRDILDDTPATLCDGDELDGQQPETTPGGPPANKPPATPGPPDHANPQNPTPPGPPADTPGGPPDDRPAGPSDDPPAGPPDDPPAGPPAGVPTGVPQGPPGGAPQGEEESEGGPPAEPGQQGATPQAEPGRPDGAGNAAPR